MGRAGSALPRHAVAWDGGRRLSSRPSSRPVSCPSSGEVGAYLGCGCWAGLRGSVLLCPSLPGLARTGVTLERHCVPARRRLLAERPGLLS